MRYDECRHKYRETNLGVCVLCVERAHPQNTSPVLPFQEL